jgi:hypothetical protein
MPRDFEMIWTTAIPQAITFLALVATSIRVRAVYADRREFRRAVKVGEVVSRRDVELHARLIRGAIRREWVRWVKCIIAGLAIATSYFFYRERIEISAGFPAVVVLAARNWFMALIVAGIGVNSVLDELMQSWALRHAQRLPQPKPAREDKPK